MSWRPSEDTLRPSAESIRNAESRDENESGVARGNARIRRRSFSSLSDAETIVEAVSEGDYYSGDYSDEDGEEEDYDSEYDSEYDDDDDGDDDENRVRESIEVDEPSGPSAAPVPASVPARPTGPRPPFNRYANPAGTARPGPVGSRNGAAGGRIAAQGAPCNSNGHGPSHGGHRGSDGLDCTYDPTRGSCQERCNCLGCAVMLSLPTICERICLRWGLQPAWEPYVCELNRVPETTFTWLLTSMKRYYLDIRILHPWHAQRMQDERRVREHRLWLWKIHQETLRAAKAGPYGAPGGPSGAGGGPIVISPAQVLINGIPHFVVASAEGSDSNAREPLAPAPINPITNGTLIESISAGGFTRSHPRIGTVNGAPSLDATPTSQVEVRWSDWINSEQAPIDEEVMVGGYLLAPNRNMHTWEESLETRTTVIEYEGPTTFRQYGERLNLSLNGRGRYQEGWKVVRAMVMPTPMPQLRLAVPHNGYGANQMFWPNGVVGRNDHGPARNSNPRLPPHLPAPAPYFPGTGRSRDMNSPLPMPSSHTRSHTTGAPAQPAPCNGRTCVVIIHDEPSVHARGMIIRVGHRCQGILRVGSKLTVERWQWYAEAATTATVDAIVAAADNHKFNSGVERRNSQGLIIDRNSWGYVPVGNDDGDDGASARDRIRPGLASVADATARGAGWRRELRIGEAYLPCSVAFGSDRVLLNEGSFIHHMGQVWEIMEVSFW